MVAGAPLRRRPARGTLSTHDKPARSSPPVAAAAVPPLAAWLSVAAPAPAPASAPNGLCDMARAACSRHYVHAHMFRRCPLGYWGTGRVRRALLDLPHHAHTHTRARAHACSAASPVLLLCYRTAVPASGCACNQLRGCRQQRPAPRATSFKRHHLHAPKVSLRRWGCQRQPEAEAVSDIDSSVAPQVFLLLRLGLARLVAPPTSVDF